ncbi:sensor histidine kinase [Asticcacaulis sp. W401b]|uniref:sensor histidine kinase n=1 Tax=Asticcacaulis sp. W401b TaxID=3388666 RepID=UPI003970AE41
MGTFVDLVQIPEPDTLQWDQGEGLAYSHFYRLSLGQSQVWATGWQWSAARFSLHSKTMQPLAGPNGHYCVSAEDRLWSGPVPEEGRFKKDTQARTLDPVGALEDCHQLGDGRTLLAGEGGIFEVARSGQRARWRGDLDGEGVDRLATTSSGFIWAMNGAKLCRFSPEFKDRDCVKVPPGLRLKDIAILPDRRVWILAISLSQAMTSGVYEVAGDALKPLPGNQLLGMQDPDHIRASPSGGFWVSGSGVAKRIEPCTRCREGWTVRETLGVRHGLAPGSAEDVVETPAGDLWVAGNNGIFFIPLSARRKELRPAPPLFTEVGVDGMPVNLEAPVRMRADERLMTVTFSAMSFLDAQDVLYRYRLSARDPWVYGGSENRIQLLRPPAGDHALEIQASADQKNWTASTTLPFTVAAPLWRSPLALAFYFILLLGLLFGAHVLRTRHLLILERQRLSIAMDLHDELGSNLNSISLLGTVAEREASAELRRAHLHEMIALAQKTGAAVRLLGQTLLRPGSDGAAFCFQLREQARRMFPDAPPEVFFELKGLEAAPQVEASIERQVSLIYLEALHNAQRHAKAKTLRVRADYVVTEKHWLLEIADDGCGFDPLTQSGGSGLSNMKLRAERIGAALTVVSSPHNGTILTLRFPCSTKGSSWLSA